MEPPCRICTRLVPPAAFDPRTLESRYKSPVTRRREYCDPRRCNAKVGTDSKFELDSRSYNVDRIVNKIEELNRNVQHLNRSRRHDEAIQPERPLKLSDTKITDLERISNAVEKCLQEMRKIKTFLEDENLWWKILKIQSTHCCQQKLPHLHGMLDGSLVTLLMLEDDVNEVPRRFVTSIPKKENNVVSMQSQVFSREFTNKDHTQQRTNSWKEHREYTDSQAVPYYSLDVKSALIEAASADRNNSTQQYAKEAVRTKHSIIVSEHSTEVDKDRSNERKTPEWIPESREIRYNVDNTQFDEQKKSDESNIAPPKETCQNTQTTFKDTLRSQEQLNSKNTEGKKNITADFESNVNLSTELTSKNTASRKPKTINERNVCPARKLLTKMSKNKSRN
ncbi:uncharacterized protein [Linepithema humile]|uniref:uncharacterized protein n=1 Tax=Linepithema humile TaxID=83485 RepID=UPI00351DBC3F